MKTDSKHIVFKSVTLKHAIFLSLFLSNNLFKLQSYTSFYLFIFLIFMFLIIVCNDGGMFVKKHTI